jgi:hypothetical protein
VLDLALHQTPHIFQRQWRPRTDDPLPRCGMVGPRFRLEGSRAVLKNSFCQRQKHYTPEEKVAILRRHLLEEVPVSELCVTGAI